MAQKRQLSTISDFIASVSGAEKTAEANLEPGSIGGPTEHPVKDVEDRTRPAEEGEQSARNERDIKEDQGPPGVDSRPEAKAAAAAKAASAVKPLPFGERAAALAKQAEGGPVATPGSAEEDQLQIGTKKAPTGEDPKNETAGVKGTYRDPGSSHPARTDNSELEGGKYAFDADTPREKLASMLQELGNDLCTQLVKISESAGHASGQSPAPQAQMPSGAQKQALDPALAEQLGWELAGLIDGSMDKQAAERMVENTLGQIIKYAEEAALETADFLDSYFEAQKQAGDPGAMPPDGAAGGPGGAPMPPPPGAGGMPPGGGGNEAAMMAALGGAGGGGAPPGAGGGMPPGGGGGGDGGMEQIAQLLAQLGITPEELMQQLQGAGDPAAGGGDPAAGGAPPGGADPAAGGAPGGMQVAAADKQAQAAMRDMLQELVTRSRSRKAG